MGAQFQPSGALLVREPLSNLSPKLKIRLRTELQPLPDKPSVDSVVCVDSIEMGPAVAACDPALSLDYGYVLLVTITCYRLLAAFRAAAIDN